MPPPLQRLGHGLLRFWPTRKITNLAGLIEAIPTTLIKRPLSMSL